jgi:hypothetical protein
MIPVIIIAATVMEGIPPNCVETAMPIGVVMDFGIKDLIKRSEKPNNFDSITTHTIANTTLQKIPARIGIAFFLNKVNFLYNGSANATVAGYRKKDIIRPPLLKASYFMWNADKNIINIVIAINNGFNIESFVFLFI